MGVVIRVVALFLAVALSACGDGGDSASSDPSPFSQAAPIPTSPPPMPKVEGCRDVRRRDSGTVVYVTVERGCITIAPFTVSVSAPEGSVTVTFTSLGVEQTATLGNWRRSVAVVERGTWRSFPNNPWDWRDGAGLLAKDGGLYLLGGWNGPGLNDVWFTRDLLTWTRLPDAPWPGRHGAGWVVHQDRLYVIGGDFHDDVWSSSDGMTWNQHASGAPFGPRYAPNAASIDGELLLYNGMDEMGVGLPSVWASSDGGSTWRGAGDVPYAPRALIHGSALFQGRLYVIGGGLKGTRTDAPWPWDTTAEYTDIWSTADGRVWKKEADTLGFAPRTHFAVLGTSHGCYVANGSVEFQVQTTGEVFFASDCVHFAPVSLPSPMPGVHATSLVEFNGSIVILGGHVSRVGSTAWQYFPEDA